MEGYLEPYGIEALKARLAAVAKLHRYVEVDGVTGDCATQDCAHDGDCPMVAITVCYECFGLVEEYVEGSDLPWPSAVMWPCDTAKALA